MSEAYLIEAAGQAAGVVIRERGGFRFFASAPQFGAIEQQLFRRTADAARAAKEISRALAANDNRISQQAWR